MKNETMEQIALQSLSRAHLPHFCEKIAAEVWKIFFQTAPKPNNCMVAAAHAKEIADEIVERVITHFESKFNEMYGHLLEDLEESEDSESEMSV